MLTPLPPPSKNQVTTEQIISALPEGTNIKSIAIIQDGILICGELILTLDEPAPPLHSVAFFAKLDPYGGFLWLQKYWGDEHNSVNALIEVEDGYLLVGSSHSRYGSTFMVIKTDINGNALWIRYSGEGQQTNVKNISVTDNGKYLIKGLINNWDSSSTIYNILIDKNGNMVIS